MLPTLHAISLLKRLRFGPTAYFVDLKPIPSGKNFLPDDPFQIFNLNAFSVSISDFVGTPARLFFEFRLCFQNNCEKLRRNS